MRILHIIPSVGPLRGGPSKSVLEMVKALRDKRIDAEIATTNDNGSYLLKVPLCQRIVYKQVPIWFFPRLHLNIKFLPEIIISFKLTIWLWRNIPKYDIVHIHGLFSYISTITHIIAVFKKIPYIVQPRGTLRTWALQQHNLKKRIFLILTKRISLNHSQVLIFSSDIEQEEAAKVGFNIPSIVLPYGLFTSPPILDAQYRLRQFLQVSENELLILFMSRLHPVKGLDYLIPALGRLKYEGFTFILAGEGSREYGKKIDNLLDSAGIKKHTRRLGFVEGKIKELLLQGSDLFVLTSHSESFSVSVLEALSAGLPVIITPWVPFASLVEKNRFGYVAQLDISNITLCLQYFLNNRQEAKKMGERASQFVLKEYKWDKIISKLSEFYTSIIIKKEKCVE